MKNNHFHEQIETEDLLKDMVILSTTQQEETVAKPKTYEKAVNSSKAKYRKQASNANRS